MRSPLITELLWDERSVEHIARHHVTAQEVEEVCFNPRSLVFKREARYIVLGQTAAGRYLFVAVVGGASMKSRLPKFKDTEEEAKFWNTHSFADYWDEFERVRQPVFVKPQKKVISLRLDAKTVDLLAAVAREKQIPYTTLVRMWVAEKAQRRTRAAKAPTITMTESRKARNENPLPCNL